MIFNNLELQFIESSNYSMALAEAEILSPSLQVTRVQLPNKYYAKIRITNELLDGLVRQFRRGGLTREDNLKLLVESIEREVEHSCKELADALMNEETLQEAIAQQIVGLVIKLIKETY